MNELHGEPFHHYVTPEGQYLGASDGEALSAVEVDSPPEYADQVWQFPGWAPSPSKLRRAEDEWCQVELAVIAAQLDALEEAEAGQAPEDLLPGVRSQWLRYRGLVRNWSSGKGDYPDITKRPTRPI